MAGGRVGAGVGEGGGVTGGFVYVVIRTSLPPPSLPLFPTCSYQGDSWEIIDQILCRYVKCRHTSFSHFSDLRTNFVLHPADVRSARPRFVPLPLPLQHPARVGVSSEVMVAQTVIQCLVLVCFYCYGNDCLRIIFRTTD